jgi:uncharacterized protein (DUF1330 family)
LRVLDAAASGTYSTRKEENAKMKIKGKIYAAVLAGVTIGVVGTAAIRAQQTKAAPGYVVAEVEVHDLDAMKQYGAKVPETLAPFNHHYVVVGHNIQALEGDPPKGGVVIIAFDSVEKAREWYDSPAYAAIRPIRQGATKSRLYIVEGLPAE